ncbi:hypothetical protein EDI_219190 [Entamoeba dispar SAW760]|uniref:Uncharacterized protein n=1 Tax=Entamoeba dispar (strain ATCC PRA-260 / SAW760) TaxID=370354 RepID=B0EQ77_ENTDS|nr:uncharacterized protein EDI_219190 [Entamoeba dispar SAW760]EDR23300.1 hypothetical protein EDI_219190 [Entamoeba dispar SAW760]|eukprot:EDR23300.1 hypothetical protein EDI_219190 [Entamoeba dispar SAW760]
MSRFPPNNNPQFSPNGKMQTLNFIQVTNGQRVPHIVTGVTQGNSVSYPPNFPMVVSAGIPITTPNLGQGHIPTTSQIRPVGIPTMPLGNNFPIPIQTNLHIPTNIKRTQQMGALNLSQINQQAQVIQPMGARQQFAVPQSLDMTRQNIVSQQQNMGLRGHGGIAIRPVPQPMSRGQVMQARGITPTMVGNPQMSIPRTPMMRTTYARPTTTGMRLAQQATVRGMGIPQPTIKVEQPQPQMFGKIISKQQQPIEIRPPIINEEKKPQIPSSVQNKFIYQKTVKQGPIEDLPPSPLPTQSPSVIPQHIQQPITAKPSLMETTPSPHTRVVEPIKTINVNTPTVNQVAPTPRPISIQQHSVGSTPTPVPGIDLRLENFPQNFIKEVQSKAIGSVSTVPRKKSENHSEELNQQKREIFKEEVEKSIDMSSIPTIPNSYPKFDEFFTQLHLYCLKNPFFYYEIDNEYLYVKTRLNDEIENLQYGFEFFINEPSHQRFPIIKKLNGEPIRLMDYGKDGILPQTVNDLMNGLFKVMREELMS